MTDEAHPAAAAAVDDDDRARRRGGPQPRRAVARSTAGSRSPQLDQHQVLAYDLAHAASAVAGCRVMLDYAEHGELESMLALRATSPTRSPTSRRAVLGRDAAWGVDPSDLAPALPFVAEHRAPALPRVGRRPPARSTAPAPRTSPTTSSSSRETFHRFAADKIRPSPSTSTARTPTSPRTSSAGSPSSAASASRCPRSTAGSRPAASPTTSAWSSPPRSSRGARSASAARSITRPEILTRALVTGGTEEQKQRVAARGSRRGELMVGVMVTEPDFGSDVAGVKVDRDRRPTAATSSTA